MKYKKKVVVLLNRINDIIIRNNINHYFSDINLLIFKNLIEEIEILEKDKESRKTLLNKIENYLDNNKEVYHYTKVLDLTALSKEIVFEVYKDYGSKGSIDNLPIKQYCEEVGINYDLFFNQVDEVKDIVIRESIIKDSTKFVFTGEPFVVNNIDNIEINLYFKEKCSQLKEKSN